MGLFSNLSFLKRSAPEPEPEPVAPPAAVAPPAPVAEAAPLPAPETPPTPAPESTAQSRAQAEVLVRNVVRELPDFLTVAVVDSATGQILAGQWAGHSGGAVEVAMANAEIVRQTRQALEALALAPAEQLEDVLVTLSRQLHLLQVLPQHDWLLYLAIRTQDTNLALARTVLRQQAA